MARRASEGTKAVLHNISTAKAQRPAAADLVTLLQQLNLLGTFAAQLASVLGKALELVQELVHHIPQPIVGQHHVDITCEQAADGSMLMSDCARV
jgi:hypothetical protein